MTKERKNLARLIDEAIEEIERTQDELLGFADESVSKDDARRLRKSIRPSTGDDDTRR